MWQLISGTDKKLGDIFCAWIYGFMNYRRLKFHLRQCLNIRSVNQQDATFHSLFISVRRSTCFGRFFRPSSGAQNCTYSVRYWSDKYLTLYVPFWAPDDGRKNLPKHVERLTEINKLWNVASCWLFSANILAMHGHMNFERFLNSFYLTGNTVRLRYKVTPVKFVEGQCDFTVTASRTWFTVVIWKV